MSDLVMAAPPVERGPVPFMPEMASEIKSPSDSYPLLREKAAYYLAHGTRLVWLIYPERKVVEVYRAGGESELYTPEHELDGGEVLPGLLIRAADIFQMN
jgi:Uma2 family endonuclease